MVKLEERLQYAILGVGTALTAASAFAAAKYGLDDFRVLGAAYQAALANASRLTEDAFQYAMTVDQAAQEAASRGPPENFYWGMAFTGIAGLIAILTLHSLHVIAQYQYQRRSPEAGRSPSA